MARGAELTYQTSASALQMANTIFGDGVTVTGASYTGPSSSSAIYSNGDRAEGVMPADTGVILSTGYVSNFTQSRGDPNTSGGTSTNTSGINDNSLFNAIAGARTYDAVWLDVDFIPTGDMMTMKFVFASDEYPEYINSQFNDVVGVWVNGSHVPISVGNGKTAVNNINLNTQPNLTVSNTNDDYNTEMDGFTITLSLDMKVNADQVNSIRIGIADTSDANYDSNLLIAANSTQTALVAVDDSVTMAPDGTKTLAALANDSGPGGSQLIITHINGTGVVAGQTVTLASGQQVTLNADGTFTIVGNGNTGATSFTYTVANGTGNGVSDVAIVTVNSVPCFVAGTRIRTPEGEVAVEALEPGDLVLTLDDGPQPLRWIGSRRVAAAGAFAPIRIKAGTFGAHGTLFVSPQHRILLRDRLAELLFGEPEVLVAAKELVNGRSITVQSGGEVDYVHLMFDRHQLVWSEGLVTESFLPGPQTMQILDRPVVEEIRALFPELDPETGLGYSPAVRPTLRGYEAQVLLTGARRAA